MRYLLANHRRERNGLYLRESREYNGRRNVVNRERDRERLSCSERVFVRDIGVTEDCEPLKVSNKEFLMRGVT